MLTKRNNDVLYVGITEEEFRRVPLTAREQAKRMSCAGCRCPVYVASRSHREFMDAANGKRVLIVCPACMESATTGHNILAVMPPMDPEMQSALYRQQAERN